MSVPTGSLLATHSDRIEEVINKSIGVFLPTLDAIWRDNIVTSQNVGPAGDMGRDWKILKVYMGSLAGVIRQGGPQDDWLLYGDKYTGSFDNQKVYFQELNNTFPDATKGPNAKPFRCGIPMRSMETNIMKTLGELTAEANPAFIGEVVAPKLEGFARNIAMHLCNYFYLSQNDNYRLYQIPDASANFAFTDTNTTAEFDTTADNYAIDRVFIGMRLEVYESTGATAFTSSNGSSTMVVTAVDELTGKFKFKADDGGTVNGLGSGTTYDSGIIVFHGSKGSSSTPFSASPFFTGIAGINSWLKGGSGSNDNYLLGAERDTSNEIDVTVHPEFKSMTKSLAGDALTEHYLRQVFRRYHAAKHKYGHTVDTVIASDGVWLAYEAQKIGREILDRTNRTSSISNEGSDGTFTFSMDGYSYKGLTSQWVDDGVVYGIKTGGGNWKRYVPPDFTGLQNNDRVESFIPFKFVASALTGTGSNQIPIFKTQTGDAGANTLVTEGVQMPGMLRMQLVPDQVDGFKLTNVATDRIYSDN